MKPLSLNKISYNRRVAGLFILLAAKTPIAALTVIVVTAFSLLTLFRHTYIGVYGSARGTIRDSGGKATVRFHIPSRILASLRPGESVIWYATRRGIRHVGLIHSVQSAGNGGRVQVYLTRQDVRNDFAERWLGRHVTVEYRAGSVQLLYRFLRTRRGLLQ